MNMLNKRRRRASFQNLETAQNQVRSLQQAQALDFTLEVEKEGRVGLEKSLEVFRARERPIPRTLTRLVQKFIEKRLLLELHFVTY